MQSGSCSIVQTLSVCQQTYLHMHIHAHTLYTVYILCKYFYIPCLKEGWVCWSRFHALPECLTSCPGQRACKYADERFLENAYDR